MPLLCKPSCRVLRWAVRWNRTSGESDAVSMCLNTPKSASRFASRGQAVQVWLLPAINQTGWRYKLCCGGGTCSGWACGTLRTCSDASRAQRWPSLRPLCAPRWSSCCDALMRLTQTASLRAQSAGANLPTTLSSTLLEGSQQMLLRSCLARQVQDTALLRFDLS